MIIGIDASNLRLGGGRTHLIELLRAADPKIDLFTAVHVWGSMATLELLPDAIWLNKIHVPMTEGGLIQRTIWQRFSLPKLCKDANCNILFAPGGSVGQRFRPTVTMFRSLLPFDWKELKRYGLSFFTLKQVILRIAQTKSFKSSDGLICLNSYASNILDKRGLKIMGRRVIIPHGIGNDFLREPRRQREFLDFTFKDPARLIYVSNLHLYKHQWIVAEAISQLRLEGFPVTLTMIGPPDRGLSRLRKVMKRLDPRGEFLIYLGARSRAQILQQYQISDVGVFASSCENMPNILLEMMASGLPIACSNRGPMHEILKNSGVYFDPENSDDIAKSVRDLLISKERRTAFAKSGFEIAQTFSWDQCARDTFLFLAKVANQSN
jgi:glycosyltransferase involved in cell wall biosynthesis